MQAVAPAGAAAVRSGGGARRTIRVFMMDLLSTIPYYTGHLCAELARVGNVEVALGSAAYSHDRGFFRRIGMRNDPGLADIMSRLQIAPAALRRALKTLESLLNLAAFAARFLIRPPDLIHVQFLPLASHGLPFETWFLRLARARGIRLVYTVHNLLPHENGERRRAVFERLYRMSDRLICHDFRAAERLAAEFGVPRERISIIPHGPLFLEMPALPPRQARARLGLPGGECLVLWQGILRPYKGVSFLLRAWERVARGGSKARLAIVGPGSPEQVRAIEEEVGSLGLGESVRLELRFVSVEELGLWYSAADVLVYPYAEVTTSGALMTGIRRGKAVIASALAAFEQVLKDGENALLAPYGDVDALAGSLARLIGDEGLRRRLGERLAESQAEAPRWPEIALATAACYKAALAKEMVVAAAGQPD